jgi:SAM-dependent methyltransferase
MSEITRVLAPKGSLGLIWLYPDGRSQPWMQKIWQYFNPFDQRGNICGAFPLYQEETLDPILLSGKFTKIERESFKTRVKCNSDSFLEHLSSYSVFQAATPKEKTDFEEFYEALMKEHFTETGKDLSSVDFTMPIVWCQKV